MQELDMELVSMPGYVEPEAQKRRESDIILNHLKIQPCNYQKIALDGGYEKAGKSSVKALDSASLLSLS
ncbi:hypothetical protein MCG98_08535 [Ruminococcus sp. OA3]|uniref:hypothetical protein n=1 Tax=Ruminococcus sp. OA3 TaxID=2914164 RepID=UPI001F057863|nr:hypothetical protein [Ruminococcus sp. OA3]MCH1982613.1 hypothetical protein [Ruminococcus sp. OA3]